MKSVETWLSCALLLMLASYSAAQAPPPQRDRPDAKLPALLTAKPVKEDPRDDELRKLLKARYNEAVGEVEARYKEYQAGRGNFDSFIEVGKRLTQAGLELYDEPADKVALLTQFVELTRAAEKIAESRLVFNGTITELRRARYQRLDVEIQLLRAKREADKAKGK